MLPAPPPKIAANQQIAVLSPAFAAPGFAPAVHEQAMTRLRDLTGHDVVEYPTTRQLDAPAPDRARDLEAAFADPRVGAIISTIGGDDQITVIPHLDPAVLAAHPKPFLGYSDNTHLHNFLSRAGVASFYGGSTQVHLGPGPGVDRIHQESLLAAIRDGGTLEITDPGVSEDYGPDWLDAAALTDFGRRVPTEPWTWSGPRRRVEGRTWGGCVEVLSDILLAGRGPADDELDGCVLLLETSEEVIGQLQFARFLRAVGERGLLARAAAVVLARPPATSFVRRPSDADAAAYRADLARITREKCGTYAPDAVVCCGPPFGHTRPQWIVPYGGQMIVDGAVQRIWARY